jgi:glycosyltransferase involved in cell wall biosynthesis
MKRYKENSIPAVSAVIITFNESSNLRRTVSQLFWCDEIIIVDSFSTDGTDLIAREENFRLFQRAFYGFGDQKRFAVSQCRHDWILCLDADEVLTNELVAEIWQELKSPEAMQALSFPSNLIFRNQRFRFGRESNRQVIKLFNRRSGEVSADRVHEKIEVEGTIKKLKNPLLHYSYRDVTQYFTKFDRYTEWCAENYFAKGKRKSRTMILISIPYYFLKYYLVDRNILNGVNGFYWSALMAFYHFVKYLKLDDMHQRAGAHSRSGGKPFRIFIPPYKRIPLLGGSAGAV